MQTTLLLDRHYQPLGLIDWQKAIVLILQEKAEIIKESDIFIRSITRKFNVPRVLRLLRRSYERHSATFSRRGVYLRDKGNCAYCGHHLSYSASTLDHVIPTSKGGKHDWLNVVTACKPCNGEKGSLSPKEAGMQLLYPPRVPSRMEIIKQTIRDSGFQKFVTDIIGT